MTGLMCRQQILDLVGREHVVSVDLVARALSVSRRSLIHEWRKRRLPAARVGRRILLPIDQVIGAFPAIRRA